MGWLLMRMIAGGCICVRVGGYRGKKLFCVCLFSSFLSVVVIVLLSLLCLFVILLFVFRILTVILMSFRRESKI